MFKRVAVLLCMVSLVAFMSIPGFGADTAKEGRVEGRIIRSNKDKSTLTVRVGDVAEKIVHYDASTKWTSQYHGDKKVNAIDASEVKDGDYVICVGNNNEKGEFNATTISKRLSHSR